MKWLVLIIVAFVGLLVWAAIANHEFEKVKGVVAEKKHVPETTDLMVMPMADGSTMLIPTTRPEQWMLYVRLAGGDIVSRDVGRQAWEASHEGDTYDETGRRE